MGAWRPLETRGGGDACAADDARAWLLVVYPQPVALEHRGCGTMAELLQAGRFPSMSISLRARASEAAPAGADAAAWHGMAADAADYPPAAEESPPAADATPADDHVLDIQACVARLAAASQRPVALVGIGAAVPQCVAAAARRPSAAALSALVLVDGRPDLAAEDLASLRLPCLFIVGAFQDHALDSHGAAMARMQCPRQLELLPPMPHGEGQVAAHEAVAHTVADWLPRALALQQGPASARTPGAGPGSGQR